MRCKFPARATSREEMLKVTPIFSSMEGSHQSVTYFSKKRCDKERPGFSQDFSQNQESMPPCLYASFEGSFRNWELRLFSTERSTIRLRQNLLSEFGELLRGHSGLPYDSTKTHWIQKRSQNIKRDLRMKRYCKNSVQKLRIWKCLNEVLSTAVILLLYCSHISRSCSRISFNWKLVCIQSLGYKYQENLRIFRVEGLPAWKANAKLQRPSLLP